MYRLAVCDDEPFFLKTHQTMAASILSEAGIAYDITLFSSADTLACHIREKPNSFDMLMLDILLGTENGVEIARALRSAGFQGGILFATSTKDYSLAGYSVYPVHYLVKPIAYGELREALLRGNPQRIESPTLSIPIKGGLTTVSLDAVFYIESLLRSLVIHAKDRDIVTGMSLKDIKQLLPSGVFLQCHKSFLVPMGKIRSITRCEIMLACGNRLPVGRVFYTQALTAFIDYMEGK